MIRIIEGRGVGSGKSYFVIDELLQHWRVGGTACVSDSFEVIWDECKKLVFARDGLVLEDDQFREIPSSQVGRVHEHTPPGTDECPVLIVIDEAQDQLDVRDFANKSKNDLFSWAAQSRHDDNDLLFVTQNAKNIDARIRRLATFTWSIKNLATFTFPGIGEFPTIIRTVTLGLNKGLYFVRTQLDSDGRTPTGHRTIVKHDRALFKCYRSKSMRGKRARGGEAVKRKQLQRAKGRHPIMKWILLTLLAVMGWGAYGLFKGDGARLMGTGPTPAAPNIAAPAETRAPKATVETRRERWVAKWHNYLRTDHAEYQPGVMMVDGMTEAVQDKVARVRKLDGGVLFVIGDSKQ